MKGCIYRRKGGKIWWVTWSVPVKGADGKITMKKKYESSHSEKLSDAENLRNTRVYQGRHAKPIPFDQSDTTYEDVRDGWIRYREAKCPGSFYIRKRGPNAGQFDFNGRNHLDEYFGGWKAKNITTEDIEAFQKKLLAKGLGNGADRAVAALRAMLRLAVKRGRLRGDQLPGYFPMVRKPRKEPEPIKEEFFEPLRAAIPEPWKTPFVLMYFTGMRSSEVERLRWEHVDLQRQRLRFEGAKTRKMRFVPLLADTADLLAALRPGKPDDLVFPGFAERTKRARVWRRAAVQVGCGNWYCRQCSARVVEGKCPEHGELTERQRRYDGGPLLRHCRNTFILNLIKAGVPLPVIMHSVGHQTITMSMLYAVAAEDELSLIREKFETAKPVAPRAKVRVMRVR